MWYNFIRDGDRDGDFIIGEVKSKDNSR